MLQVLIELSRSKNVLEIGTSIGVSALWMCLGLIKTGGRLTTIELSSDIARQARENFKKAGLENIVTVIERDAFSILPLLTYLKKSLILYFRMHAKNTI